MTTRQNHTTKQNHAKSELEEHFLKDLSVSFQSGLHKMFSFIVLPVCTSQISSFVSEIFYVFGNNTFHEFKDSRRFKIILWSIIGVTRGGPNRARILNLLITESLNSNQIAKRLNLDHKTVRHHLKILTKNSLIKKSSEKSYGVGYILTPIMQQNTEILKEIVAKMEPF